MAGLMVLEALLFAGRLDDASAMLHQPGETSEFGSITAATNGLIVGLVDVLAGRSEAAVVALEPVIAAAAKVSARPAEVAARALLAEATWRTGDRERALQILGDLRLPLPGGVTRLLVDRARAVTGDEAAAAALVEAGARLQTPGLMLPAQAPAK
jgi:hypothetical protein